MTRHVSPRRSARALRLLTALLLVWLNSAPLLPTPAIAASASVTAPAAAAVGATLTDALQTDADGNGRASAGDTLRYTLDITNTGTTDAADVAVDLGLDPNTALVPGSARISPLAFAENYATGRDTALAIAAPGLLANDTGTAPLAVVAGTVATTGGGSVTIAADGGFSYTPARGYIGRDSFGYTVRNAIGDDTATAQIQVDSAPTIVSVSPAAGSVGVALDSSLVVTFDEPVTAAAGAFVLVCNAVPVTFAVGAGPAVSFTIDPATDLPGSAACTLSVVAANISDADTLDPPDLLAADTAVSFTTTDAAPAIASIAPAADAREVPLDANLTIAFSEPVTVTGSWFTLACATSGTRTPADAAVSGGPITYTVDLATDFAAAERCALTVVAAQVHDRDAADPPDTMAADFSAAFVAEAAPTVSATVPVSGAPAFPNAANLSVSFDQPVDLTSGALTLSCASAPVTFATTPTLPATGVTTITIDPTASLPINAACTLTVVASGVTDSDSNDPPDAMGANVAVNFTTADTAPTVLSTSPSAGATTIGTGTTIQVVFSEPVNVSAASFALACPAGTPQSFSVAGSGTATATFTPSAALPENTTCAVTVVASGVTDSDSNDPPDAMAADVSFGFTTDAAPRVMSTTPAAGASSVAAGSPISIMWSEPVNVAAGGVTIACPGAIALAGLPFSGTTGLFTPTTSLPSTATCTVTVIAAKVSDQDTGDAPDTMAADASFSFTTTDPAPTFVSSTPSDGATTLGTGTTIQVIFSEPVTVSAASFALACPAGTPQSFTVSGSGTSAATLTPSAALPEATTCAVTVVGASVSDVDAIDPPDTMNADYNFSFTTDSAPTVSGVTPLNGATNVSITTTVTIGFSERIDAASGAFALACPSGTPRAFTTSAAGNVASITLTPSAPLPVNTLCAVTIVAAKITDYDTGDAPDAMAADYSFGFTTVDDSAPSVASVSPTSGATTLGTGTTIQVVFSEPVTVSAASFALACPAGTPQSFTVSGSGTSAATLTPSAALPEATTCAVTVVGASVSDVDAIDPPDTMNADYNFSFTTDSAPTVLTTVPANGATGATTDATIAVTFSELVNVAIGGVTISCPTSLSFAGLPFSGTTMVLTPTAALPAGASCTVAIAASAVTDQDAGDPPDTMAASYSFSFATDAAPSVVSVSPANGAAGVTTNGTIDVVFSEPVDVTTSAFTLACPVGTPQTFAVSGSGTSSITLTPSAALPEGTTCALTIVAANVSDSDANDPPDTVTADVTSSFTTDARPTVSSTVPANGATGVNEGANIVVNFSENVNVAVGSFSIECPSGMPVAFSVSGSGTASATLAPTGNLPYDTLCSITVLASQVSDSDANDPPDTMAASYSFSFRVRLPAPAPVADSFGPIVGNILADSSAVSFSVLTNDTNYTGTISAFDASSANGGTVTLNTSTGTFSYNPPAGYKGSDSWKYTVTNATGSTQATVTVAINDVVWFVDDLASNGDGRYGSPLNDSAAGIGSINTVSAGDRDGSGDVIFVYAGTYTRSFALESGQRLVGQGGSLSAALTAYGITLPASQSIAGTTAATRPTLTNASDVLTLASNNDVRDLNVTMSGANDAVYATGALGTSTISNVTITSGSGGRGLNLDTTSGTLSLTAAPIAMNGIGRALSIDGGSTVITLDASSSVTQTGGGSIVVIANRSGGAVTLKGPVTGGAISNNVAISLTNNQGSVIFAGTVTATASGARALDVVTPSAFALTMSAVNNTLRSNSSQTGVISIGGAGVKTLDVQLQSVNTNDGGTTATRPDTAIALANTIGSFAITGTGTTLGSGGRIIGTNGSAIALTSVNMTSLRLDNFDIGDSTVGPSGVRPIPVGTVQIGKGGAGSAITIGGSTNTGISLTRSRIVYTRDSAISGVDVRGLAIAQSVIRDSGTANDRDGVQLSYTAGGGGAVISITNSSITQIGGAAIWVDSQIANAVGSLTISGNTITGNNLGVNLSTSSAGDIEGVSISGNTLAGVATQINLANTTSNSGSRIRGTIASNTVSASDPFSIAIWAVADGSGAITADFNANTVTAYGDSGIDIESRGTAANVDAQLRNNVVSGADAANGLTAIFLRSGNSSSDASRLCVNLSQNDASAAAASFAIGDYYLDRFPGSATFALQGLTPASGATPTQVENFVIGTDVAPGSRSAFAETGSYVAGTCALPLLAVGGGPGAQAKLTQAALDAAAQRAIAAWSASGISEGQRAALHNVSFEIAQLASGRLGETIGMSVAIDDDAAGWGWSGAGQIDLVTVVMHELGHILGREDVTAGGEVLMAATLAPGVSHAPAAVAPIAVGTLPADKHVRIVFDVTIGAPLPSGVTQLAAQATVRGSGLADTRSDDPATSVAGDATLTALGSVLYLPLVSTIDTRLPDLVVDRLAVTGGGIEVVVRNAGSAPVTAPFWVDVYLDPRTPPTSANQVWNLLGTRGAVWGITAGALPLAPGATLTLRSGDGYYRADMSATAGALPSGAAVYAQVDSANANNTDGAILERHERDGGPYNNISRITLAQGVTLSSAAEARVPASLGAPLPARQR